VGIYVVQFATLIFRGEKPEKIITGGHLNSNSVDESSSTTLIYANGRTATLVAHSKVAMNNEAFVFGTKGTIKVGLFGYSYSISISIPCTKIFEVDYKLHLINLCIHFRWNIHFGAPRKSPQPKGPQNSLYQVMVQLIVSISQTVLDSITNVMKSNGVFEAVSF